MQGTLVKLERSDGAVVLFLDRPPANAYDYDFLRELGAVLDEVRVDDSVGGLVVASASERFFSAGADVAAFAAASQRRRLMTCLLAQEVFLKLERLPFPTVAAIAGACLGGGLELALSCGHRLAAKGAYSIGLPEVAVGLLPGSGGTQRLPRLLGLSRGLELIVRGRLLTPAEALEAGLVDRLLPSAKACLATAVELAQGSGQEDDA